MGLPNESLVGHMGRSFKISRNGIIREFIESTIECRGID